MNHANVRRIVKALGDDTRFAIFDWLCEQSGPRSIGDISSEFDLHANTVRPHLDRLREAGLVELDASSRGSVGRPQHRFKAVRSRVGILDVSKARSVFFGMLIDTCDRAAVSPQTAFDVGYDAGHGSVAASAGEPPREPSRERPREPPRRDPIDVLGDQMTGLGFEPRAEQRTVKFVGCPFHDLAEANPRLICSLHEGFVTGIVNECGGEIREFHNIRQTPKPCCAMLG